jgi:prepilin-type N-terminal cleavage/methylation domain-containing protein
MTKFLSHSKGFTLVELIVALAIMALLVALSVPRFQQIQRDARIKTVEQQATAIQAAVNSWVGSIQNNATKNVSSISSSFGNTDYLQNGFVWLEIKEYLGGTFVDKLRYSNGLIYSPEMEQLKDTAGNGLAGTAYFNGATVTPAAPNLGHACIYIYWPKAANRYTTNPVVVLFLPK